VRVTPRAAEVKAVVQVMEDTGYDTAEAMAKDIIKRVAELFAERDWHAYACRLAGTSGLVLMWGPLSSPTEVQRFASKVGIEGEHREVKLYSTAAMLGRIEDELTVEAKDAGTCQSCGHPRGLHLHEKKVGQCQLDGCNCKADIKK
jgi:hypothetical protein